MTCADKYLAEIDAKKDELYECSDYIFDHPELCFEEFESSKKFAEMLQKEGFETETNLGGLKTAVSGKFGSGRPVIGLLGEFDALSGLSQESGNPEKNPLPNSKDGHGCGHNLLGTAVIGTAIAIKKYLEETHKSGTVICFGCPAEEGGSGKTIMACEGVFDNLDAAVAWHPGTSNCVINRNLLANKLVKYIYDGKAAHAAGAPHNGRSALDAVELLNVGVQFLREHMPPYSRVHYAITDTGGISPNVVQPHAEVLYLIRGKDNESVRQLAARVDKIAEGAALMTETTLSTEFQKACSNTICNETLQRFAYDTITKLSPPVPSEEDKEFIRKLLYKEKGKEDPRYEEPFNYNFGEYAKNTIAMASSDVGDVSWICPVVRVNGCTWGKGTGAHDWLTVAQGKTPYAKEAMMFAAKMIASIAIGLYENPEIIEKAKKEHKEAVGENGYDCPYPKKN